MRIRRVLEKGIYRIGERLGDSWFGVSTGGIVPVARIAPRQDDLRDCIPMGYGSVFAALVGLSVRRSQCGFLDYGCGKGRACVVAAALGYRSVTGVELSPGLAEEARRNLARMRWRHTADCSIVTGDACVYEIPDSVQVIYFFHPFVGAVLRTVIERIRSSLLREPRTLHIVYFNNDDFDWELADADWIRKTDQRLIYPRLCRGSYVARR